MGGRIRPSSNGSPSPLVRIKNISNGQGGNRQEMLLNVVVSGLRIENDKAATGSGSGIAIEVLDDYQNVPNGGVWHIKLEDLYIENFGYGVKITNAYDIVLNNLSVGQCLVGLRCEVNDTHRIVGLVRLYGGEFLNNSYHVSLDGVTGTQFGQLQAFGCCCASQRTNGTQGPEGISINKWTQGILLFGCHFEDLNHGIIYSSGVTEPPGTHSLMSIAAMGCTFHLMRVPGAGIDTNSTSAQIASTASVGNNYGPSTNTSQFYNTPRASQGVMIGGNTQNANYAQTYPPTGYVEHSPANNKNAYRVSAFTTSSRPSASAIPVGTIIFNTSTNKINISDGANWRDANGNLA